MRRTLPAAILSIALCVSILLPIRPASASGVPQAVLDLRPSVVRVVCQTDDGGGFLGSGFAVGKDSVEYIVTNFHVVESNPENVTVLRGDNRQIAAKPCVQLPERDLCVLRLSVPQYDMQPVELFDGGPALVGEAVYTLGFPAAADVLSGVYTGDPGNVTVTEGIVSALKSWTIHESGTQVNIVQIDASISPGNSGGPLVNEQGQVLGVNTITMLMNSQNINGAVSILELTDALIHNGIPFKSASSSPDGNNSFSPFWIIGICLFAAAAIAVLLFVILRGKKKPDKMGKSAGLAEYLRQWGGPLPYDTAIRVLEPVLRELAFMHAQGRYHADICPENIFVSGNRACLRMPDGRAGSNRVILRPGYSPPEQFRADGRIGPWSDVYSICAVIFYMVTGTNPPGAVDRQAAGGEGGFGFGSANIGDAQAAAVYAGLMLDAAKRPQNCAELLDALGLPVYTATAAAITTSSPKPAEAVSERKPVGRRGKRLLIALSAVFLALCVGFYLFEEISYSQAVARIQTQEYEGGIDKLNGVLGIFKERGKWMDYAQAGAAMQGNRYNEARAVFRALGDFYNAREMIREVSYQEGLYLITQGDFGRAKELFISLGDNKDTAQMIFETDYQKAMHQLKNNEFIKAAAGFAQLARNKYKDSDLMVLETDYQQAMYQLKNKEFVKAIDGFTYLANKDYKDSKAMVPEANYQYAVDAVNVDNFIIAYPTFKKLGEYKDSSKYCIELTERIYNDGISFYRKQDYSSAQVYFAIIKPYKRSDNYIMLLYAHNYIKYPVIIYYYQTLSLYNSIKALGDFEDAVVVSKSLKKILSKY